MLVLDANDATGMSHRDQSRCSPVLHPAVQNLLDGLKSFGNEVQVEVWYGKREPLPEETRSDGNLHYRPVTSRSLPIPGMGGGYAGRTLALLRALRHSNADLIHAQGTERECGLVAALLRKPSLLTLHGNFREIAATLRSRPFSNFWVCAQIERAILPRFSAIHALSTHTETSVKPFAKAVRIIPNAVSDEFFEVTPAPTQHPNIHHVAGITEWKNPLGLIAAGDVLRQHFPETLLHFHGYCNPDHPYGAAFMAAIRERPWCHYHGVSSSSQLTEHLRLATCTALPSIQENFGLAAAESMAAAVPVVASSVGGLVDVVQDGITGMRYDPADPNGLSNALIHIHKNPSLRHRMSDAARAHSTQNFRKEIVAEAHLNLYQHLLHVRI
jgi:glycosyltransferase involved in cell wall biosynthesis